MRKLRTFLFSSLPLLLALGIQVVAMFYLLIIAMVFLLGIAPVLTGNTYSFYDVMTLAEDMNFNSIILICFSISCSIVFGIWYTKRCGGTFQPNIRKNFHPLELLGIVFLIPGTQYMSSIITAGISVIFPSWLEAYEEMMESAGLGEEISFLMMLYSICLAPISEELIFRGVTLRIAKRAFPFWLANLIQAFFFGVFHMNIVQGCYTFILGLFLGYICEKGGSIYHVILFHVLFNIWGTTSSEWFQVEDPTIQGIIIILSTIAGLTLGLFFFNKGSHKKKLSVAP